MELILIEIEKKPHNRIMKRWQVILFLILGGVLVGFVNGFLGAGGGIIVVPLIRYLLKLDVKVSHATAIFVILPICVASGIVYIIKGFFDFSVALPVLIGSLVGAVAGCFLLSKLKNNVIVYIFSVIMIVAGVKLIF